MNICLIHFLHFRPNFLAKGLGTRLLPQFLSLPMAFIPMHARARARAHKPTFSKTGGNQGNQGNTRVPAGSELGNLLGALL